MSSISGLQKKSFTDNKKLYLGAGLIIDALSPRSSTRDVDTIVNYRQEIYNDTASPLGSTVNTKLPTEGHLVDIIYKLSYAATTGTLAFKPFRHVRVLQNTRLKHGSSVIYNFEPEQVWNALMPTLDPAAQSEIWDLSGGMPTQTVNTAADVLAMPMIQPFSHFWHQTEPLNLTIGRNSTYQLDLKFRALTDLVETGAGGGAVTNLVVICVMIESADELVKQKHIKENKPIHSFSYYTKRESAVTTATKKPIKISPSGLTKHISIIAHLSSDVSSNDLFFNKYIDELEISADGLKDVKFESSQEARIWSLIEGFKPVIKEKLILTEAAQNTISYCKIGFVHQYAPNTIFNNMKAGHYTGGLTITSINSFNLNITHSLGANADVDVIAFLYALYAYDDLGNLSTIN